MISPENGLWYVPPFPHKPKGTQPAQRPNKLTTTPPQNKQQSGVLEPVLALQGIGWLTRKAVGLATFTLDVKQFNAPPAPPGEPSGGAVSHVEIDQLGTGGIKGTSEKRCLDNIFREHSDWLFGNVKGQSRWSNIEDVDDAYLKNDSETAELVVPKLALPGSTYREQDFANP